MQHTFLFEEGYWQAAGQYYTETGQVYEVIGQIRVYHEDNLWISSVELKVVDQEAVKINNRYEVIPWEKGQELTTWVSVSPGIGVLEGTYTVVADCILSAYKAEKGDFSGAEVYIKTASDRYLNRGVLVYKGQEKLSSWSIELKRNSEQ